MQLNTVQWISLPLEIRAKLVEIFNIPRSASTEVENNTVVTDGYTHKDLAVITVEKMQAFLLDTVEEDYFKLFHRVLDAIKPAAEVLKDETVEIINANDVKQDEQKETEQVERTNPTRNGKGSRSKKDAIKG